MSRGVNTSLGEHLLSDDLQSSAPTTANEDIPTAGAKLVSSVEIDPSGRYGQLLLGSPTEKSEGFSDSAAMSSSVSRRWGFAPLASRARRLHVHKEPRDVRPVAEKGPVYGGNLDINAVWTPLSSVYYLVFSVLTIGPGNLHPRTHLTRVLTLVALFIGLGALHRLLSQVWDTLALGGNMWSG